MYTYHECCLSKVLFTSCGKQTEEFADSVRTKAQKASIMHQSIQQDVELMYRSLHQDRRKTETRDFKGQCMPTLLMGTLPVPYVRHRLHARQARLSTMG